MICKAFRSMMGPVLGLIAVMVILTVAVPAQGLMIAVAPAGDGYFHNESGSSYDYFESGANPNPVQYMFWGTSDTLQHNTSYAQFSLSTIPAASTITSATLNIYMTGTWIGTSTYAGYIKHVANSSAANGNASQKLGGSDLVANIGNIGAGWVSFDITTLLQNDLNNLYNYCCFSFDAATDGTYDNRNSGFSFSSGESGNSVPYLNVVVPEPMTLGLLVLGGVGLLRRRRV